jgi:thiamine-phosphate pyrophosphorylase
MQFSFTPAAQRALAGASSWSSGADRDELSAEALLIGLLMEPECRAAQVLARSAVDVSAVRAQWPALAPTAPTSDIFAHGENLPHKPFSAEVEHSLRIATQRTNFLPQPAELATEHILLGLATDDHGVAVWLRRQAIDPDAVEAEIRKLHGLQQVGWADHSESHHDVSTCRGDLRGSAQPAVAAIRVLDAAANRAREGLRVIEDYVRFVLDDAHLTGLCKQLRHDLVEALAPIGLGDLLSARDTEADVGTALSNLSERRREDAAGVLRANFARVQESLRSLEEFGKLENLGETFKQLRYRVYTLERSVVITHDSVERLASAKLYVLLDGCESLEQFERLARVLIDAGVDVLQLRDKRLADRDLLVRARLLWTWTRGRQTLFIMNDRPDLAVLARADGVHLGQDELSIKDARSIIGPRGLIGVSTHSIEQAHQAVLDGANYLGVGPVFPSETKHFEGFPGVALLQAVAADIGLPAFAIGGVTPENVSQVLATGFSRIAVGAAVTSAADPATVVRKLRDLLSVARP